MAYYEEYSSHGFNKFIVRAGYKQECIGEEPFMLTYGDAVCNVNISELLMFYKSH